jgi:hypothetical protein
MPPLALQQKYVDMLEILTRHSPFLSLLPLIHLHCATAAHCANPQLIARFMPMSHPGFWADHSRAQVDSPKDRALLVDFACSIVAIAEDLPKLCLTLHRAAEVTRCHVVAELITEPQGVESESSRHTLHSVMLAHRTCIGFESAASRPASRNKLTPVRGARAALQ